MPAPEVNEPRRSKLLPVLFWSGVGLAPIAALLLLMSQSNGPLRIAGVLAILCVVLIGLSVILGGNAEAVRTDLENALREDIDALRGEVVTAAHSSQQVLGERLRVVQHNVEVLRGQLEAAREGSVGPGVPPAGPRRAESASGTGRVPEATRAAARVPDGPRAAASVPERGPGPVRSGDLAGQYPAADHRSARHHPAGAPSPSADGPAEGTTGGRLAGGRASVSASAATGAPLPPVGQSAAPPSGVHGAVPTPGVHGAGPSSGGFRSRAGLVRRTENVQATRQAVVDRGDDSSAADHRYAGSGHHGPDTGDAGWSDKAAPGRRSTPPGDDEWAGRRSTSTDPEPTDEPRGGQRWGRSAAADDDPDVDYWSGLRAGGRWAPGSTDDQAPEGEMGDRRAAPFGDGSDAEPHYEDRWAAVHSEEPLRGESSGEDSRWEGHRRRGADEYGYPPADDVPRAGGSRRRGGPVQPDHSWR